MKNIKLEKSKRFLIPILLVILSIIFIASISTYINISIYKKHMNENIEQYKIEHLTKNKNIIKKQVELVNNSINFQITRIENKLRLFLKERIKTSLKVAQYIYDKQKGKIPDSEIKKRISEHLSAMKFNGNRGYFFTYGADDNIIIGHARDDFINKDMTTFKDTKGAKPCSII